MTKHNPRPDCGCCLCGHQQLVMFFYFPLGPWRARKVQIELGENKRRNFSQRDRTYFSLSQRGRRKKSSVGRVRAGGYFQTVGTRTHGPLHCCHDARSSGQAHTKNLFSIGRPRHHFPLVSFLFFIYICVPCRANAGR